MQEQMKKTVVAVSGGFDPLHPGHVRMFHDAKKLGDELVVILNNDNWLYKKKGYVFMNERERKEVIKAIKYVDQVVITNHPKDPKDAKAMGVSKELKELKPDIFANGGDRDEKNAANLNSSLHWDIKTCAGLGIKMVFNVGHGGKIQSSSALVDQAMRKAPRKIAVKVKSKR
ncbi:MAG: adenylyltransferase/cytidyltransferase family protein [Candidatus Doudnabacteria bacterium]|nr:adenylyltransferase/cytidyltransferase family protein [Candidatus Doudnabacteria bacterium]